MDYLPIIKDEKTKKLTVKVTPKQKQFIDSQAKIACFLAGLQSGKTLSGSVKLAKTIIQRGEGAYLVVAPTYGLLRAMLPKLWWVLEVFGLVSSETQHKINASEIRCNNGAIIYYRSAEDPEKVQSWTAKAFWMDECQQNPLKTERVFDIAWARTAVEKAQIMLTGTTPPPNMLHGHWLYEKIYRPWLAGDEDIEIITARSIDNPGFDRKTWERLRRTMPEGDFRAEYMGEFVEGAVADALIIPDTLRKAQDRWRRLISLIPLNLYDWVAKNWPAMAEALPEWQEERITVATQGEVIDIGVDVASFGGDRNVATVRWKNLVLTQIDWGGQRTTETAGLLCDVGRELQGAGFGVRFWVDRPGIGGGVWEQLLADGWEAYEYHPQHNPLGEPERYRDLKAWLAFKLRERLIGEEELSLGSSPTDEMMEAIPPIPTLIDQLLAWRFGYDKAMRYTIVDPRNSPDFADSLLISLLPVYTAERSLLFVG
jgi:hypothetical protein